YCMGMRKLYVILGRKAASAFFRQRKAHKTDKESSLSFRFVAFLALGLLSITNQNELKNKSKHCFRILVRLSQYQNPFCP
ncbi:MAG: hypothetical protein IJW69_01360, partial [Clostridia bacterium]|nr:hypothetical protein [Clostridia bacterium]